MEGPTLEMLRKVLSYKPLHANQKALLRVLKHAADWISAHEIASAIGGTRKGLAGIVGGFGGRGTAQRGWPRRKDTGVKPSRWMFEPVGTVRITTS
jgi:hypothetical protein